MINAQNSEISPSQECVLDCINVIFQEQIEAQSKLRSAIPDLLKMLLYFVGFSVQSPTSKFLPAAGKDGQVNWAQNNMISFAELSLRTAVSYFSKVSVYPEVVEQQVFVDFVQVSN